MSGGRLGAVELARLRQRLSERDRAILAQVSELRLMSTWQIEQVHFPAELHTNPGSAGRCCRRVLKRLARDRLLVRLNRRVGGVRAGSSGYIYTLGPAGQRVLELDGPRRRLREPSQLHVDHTLAISTLVVSLTLAQRQGRCELLALEAEPACWRPVPGLARVVLRPDLFVALGVGEYERRWFVELDRETANLPALLRKCRLYDNYYRSGAEQAAFGVFPRVAWLVRAETRAKRLQTAIERNPELTSALFLISSGDAVQALTEAGL
jgi:hypothetical protein